MTFDLDDLEREAVRPYHQCYGKPQNDQERFYVQKGIECMRGAVAIAQEAAALNTKQERET